MADLERDVQEAFLAELGATDNVSGSVVDGLCKCLSATKLPKPEELADLYAAGSGQALA